MQQYLSIETETLAAEQCYWTAREIAQQPDTWTAAHAEVERNRERVDSWLSHVLAEPRLRLVLTGAGSSAFVGQTLAPWLSRRLKRRGDAIATTDLVANPSLHLAENAPTLMVSFARSGDSPESVASVNLADQFLHNCSHLVLTCNREGELAKLAQRHPNALSLWMPERANDRSLVMTSGYTSMLVSCATVFAPEPDGLDRAVESARFVLRGLASRARAIAERRFKRFVALGSGCLLATAREACLKCLEITNGQLAVIADTPLGFRHGPKSAVDGNTCVVLLLSSDAHAMQYDLDLLLELCLDQRAAHIVALSPAETRSNPNKVDALWLALQSAAPATVDRLMSLPSQDRPELIALTPTQEQDRGMADDLWTSLPHLVFCQLLAFFKARALGVAADNPSPSGAINRVVEGVTIYPFRG